MTKTAWPADKVERRKVSRLIPYARNARLHAEWQVDQIAASIREFGWTVPVLLDEKDGIIAGHGRVLAAKKLGIAEIPAMVAGDVAYVWHPSLLGGKFGESLEESGFKLRSQIIWVKNNFAIGRGDYHWRHETCLYAVRKNGHWSGDRKQSTVWEIPKPQKSETGHSTQKPVECMKRPIENNSSPGQAVYEPFSGSGTTIIAAEMTGRCCHAIEIHPPYVDVAVKR